MQVFPFTEHVTALDIITSYYVFYHFGNHWLMEIEWSSFIVIAVSPLLYGLIESSRKKKNNLSKGCEEGKNIICKYERGEYDWLWRN